MNSTVSLSTLNATFDLQDELDRPTEPRAGLFIPAHERPWLTPDAITARERGAPKIYPEAVEAGYKLMEGICNEHAHMTLLAQPGQGKSAVTVWTIIGFLKWAEHGNQLLSTRPQVFWATMIGDNDLRDQTMLASIRPAGLEPYVEAVHINNFPNKQTQTQPWVNNILEITNYTPSAPDTPREPGRSPRPVFIIFDECHLALGTEGVLARLCEDIGIDLNTPRSRWKNSHVYVLTVSATPFSQDLNTVRGARRPPMTSGEYRYVKLAMSPDYLGPANLLAQGRLHDNKGIRYTAQDYHAFRARVREGIKAFVSSYNATYPGADGCPVSAVKNTIVFRVRSRRAAEEYARVAGDEVLRATQEVDACPITRGLDTRLRLVFFHHQKAHGSLTMPASGCRPLVEREIAEFVPALAASDPTHPFNVYFIIKAAQAGKVLRAPSLSLWVDMTGTQTDTVVQSVGRGCGYGKERETYPIYCNLAEVQQYLNWYDTVNQDVPSAVTSAHTRISSRQVLRATRLVYFAHLSDMDAYRCGKGLREFGFDNRSVRNIDQMGRTLTSSPDDSLQDRIEKWLRDLTGDVDGLVLGPSDASVYYFPADWDGQLHANVEQYCGELLTRYRPALHALYAAHGPGYYWQEPVAYHDTREHKSTSLLRNRPVTEVA